MFAAGSETVPGTRELLGDSSLPPAAACSLSASPSASPLTEEGVPRLLPAPLVLGPPAGIFSSGDRKPRGEGQPPHLGPLIHREKKGTVNLDHGPATLPSPGSPSPIPQRLEHILLYPGIRSLPPAHGPSRLDLLGWTLLLTFGLSSDVPCLPSFQGSFLLFLKHGKAYSCLRAFACAFLSA